VAVERSHSMAVCADQFTLGDLVQDRLTTEAGQNHVANLASLCLTR